MIDFSAITYMVRFNLWYRQLARALKARSVTKIMQNENVWEY